MKLRFVTALAAFLLSACASAAQVSPTVGRLYHYVRTNQDGTEPERVVVFRRGVASLAVFKEVSTCTNAAYVTAEFDLARGQPRSYVGGRVARDGTQDAFAWLILASDGRSLSVRAPSRNVNETHRIHTSPPLRVYDFDLADINAFNAGRPPSRSGSDIQVALFWPVENAPQVLRFPGNAHARFAAEEEHNGRPSLKFNVTGALNGQLWLDAEQGHILEARFAEPNHMEYHDFQLRLDHVSDGGEAEWRELLAAHWRGCPPPAQAR